MIEREPGPRFDIDPESVAGLRAELRAMVKGIPVAEAAVDDFNDWQVIEALERLWAAEPMAPESKEGTAADDWLGLLLGS